MESTWWAAADPQGAVLTSWGSPLEAKQAMWKPEVQGQGGVVPAASDGAGRVFLAFDVAGVPGVSSTLLL